MPMDPLPIWIAQWALLGPEATPDDIASFVDERVTMKLGFGPAATMSPPPQFTFQKSIFASTLKIIGLVPSPDPISPRTAMVNAWQTAVLASTMVISTGTAITPPPPPSTGIVLSLVAVIDPTIALAFSGFLADMLTAPNANTPADVVFPKACFAAFSKLSYSMVGTDTTPTPAGPLPIVLPLTPVL